MNNYTDNDLEYFEQTEKSKSGKPQPEALAVVSMAELQQTQLPPLRFVAEGLLPRGLCILASPPKYGKSWLVLDLCLRVAAGEPFLGRQTNKGACLYLALEDSYHRLQERAAKLLTGRAAPEGFDCAICCADIAEGLTEQLEAYVGAHPEAALIVIDTFQKIRSGSGKESAYSTDYKEVGRLKSFADSRGVCVLLVHHLRKMADETDVFNRVSGTAGIVGAADTVLVLSRLMRTDTETMLSVVGRDVECIDETLTFDKPTCRWSVVPGAEERAAQAERERFMADPLVRTITELMRTHPAGWSGTASELFACCGEITHTFPDDTPAAMSKRLKQLSPKLFEYERILYRAPAQNGSNGKRLHSLCCAGQPTLLED